MNNDELRERWKKVIELKKESQTKPWFWGGEEANIKATELLMETLKERWGEGTKIADTDEGGLHLSNSVILCFNGEIIEPLEVTMKEVLLEVDEEEKK